MLLLGNERSAKKKKLSINLTMAEVYKHTRIETKEDRRGSIREHTVTTWDVVEDGQLLSEHNRKKDALEALRTRT